MDDQFQRVRAILGDDVLEAFHRAHVCLVGYGAVGSFAAEVLVRSGIGHIRIIDADTYDVTNINRQLGASHPTVGHLKVDVARERLLSIHPNLDLECQSVFIDATNLSMVDAPFGDGIRPEWLVDAIDTLDSKVGLLKYGVEREMHVFSSMGAARKLDASMIQYRDLSKTEVCPLAREVRKRLKAVGITSGIGCVYSREMAAGNRADERRLGENKCAVNVEKKRPILGSLLSVTGAFGLRLGAECLRAIEETLR